MTDNNNTATKSHTVSLQVLTLLDQKFMISSEAEDITKIPTISESSMEQETNSETCMTKHEETCFLCTCTVVIRTPEDQTHNQMTANEGNSFQVLSALHNDGNVVSVNVTQV
jgi:hypothetical protein